MISCCENCGTQLEESWGNDYSNDGKYTCFYICPKCTTKAGEGEKMEPSTEQRLEQIEIALENFEEARDKMQEILSSNMARSEEIRKNLTNDLADFMHLDTPYRMGQLRKKISEMKDGLSQHPKSRSNNS